MDGESDRKCLVGGTRSGQQEFGAWVSTPGKEPRSEHPDKGPGTRVSETETGVPEL